MLSFEQEMLTTSLTFYDRVSSLRVTERNVAYLIKNPNVGNVRFRHLVELKVELLHATIPDRDREVYQGDAANSLTILQKYGCSPEIDPRYSTDDLIKAGLIGAGVGAVTGGVVGWKSCEYLLIKEPKERADMILKDLLEKVGYNPCAIQKNPEAEKNDEHN
jgi:hypothetical protein